RKGYEKSPISTVTDDEGEHSESQCGHGGVPDRRENFVPPTRPSTPPPPPGLRVVGGRQRNGAGTYSPREQKPKRGRSRGQEKEGDRKRGVEQQRQQIDERKCSRPEEIKRQHRRCLATFDPCENSKQDQTPRQGCKHAWVGPAEIRRRNQPETSTCQSDQHKE